ncbi:GNAT family N-acetyltransferase [Streptomyces radicis]|uniref:GNAT family N-acetyltransferase n=1 Tax=Streptomyces radicis TaxID=1750517 RepID=A0A3A9W0C2_9ACTN|nr:GNAT family N-acetyltransferase [Streptomyces radicis]RKN06711.1 GNAT family N-acetyltransferase [Streptomyces radicis]RKN19337.1 GNAT family N-acetyltransferase [Streptomyces radicis]
MLTTPTTRVLGSPELDDVLAVLHQDPVANAFVTARVLDSGLEAPYLGGEMWGYYRQGKLTSLCYAGANLVPIRAGAGAVRAFAERALREGRRCSSIVGPAGPTARLWARLEPHWGPARQLRPRQPLLATDTVPRDIAPDPLVRRLGKAEMDLVFPAAVAMFTEEVGISPLDAHDGGLAYQSRVAESLGTGRCFARVEDGRVVFKAEIGAVTPDICQLQGVWTAPDRRGRGLATAGLATVLAHALAETAPVASLYVNDFNAPALAVYRRLGFTRAGTLMSVLF